MSFSLFSFSYSASGTNVVAIDNKIEQAMVSTSITMYYFFAIKHKTLTEYTTRMYNTVITL